MVNVNKRKIFQLMIISLLLIVSTIYTQTIYTQKDVDVCNSKFQLAVDAKLASKSMNEIIVEIGKSFIGTDYVAHSIEKGDKETLVVFLTGMDCYLLAENTLVLSRCIKSGKTTFEDYTKELENIRYRDGKMNEYPSRLHYFSDWIYDMNKRGIVKDITKEIGGVLYEKKINFMSKHTDSYMQLKNNPKFVEEIKMQEEEISARKYFYIPKEEVSKHESKIEPGDIIGITSTVEGLDIAHVGIAVKGDNGRIHFMHAPNIGYKVQITEKPLADYLMANKKQGGIMVARLLEIKNKP
jgi:hypothetical protein